jgi:ABC-2 type transport system ATP-binding protein
VAAPVIDVTDLTKVFNRSPAVDGISFQVHRGELLGFLGPNGAGKTTTIAMLLGLIAPTTGTVRILGQAMPEHRHAILARVNFSSPYVALPYDLTVQENLTVFGHLYGLAAVRRTIRELSEVFGVAHLLNRRTGALSSGETARVNLVKAFLNDPDVLFLDEPTAALDPEAADTVRSLLLRLGRERGLTIFYTSHNMREVERLSSRIIFLHQGHIIADGPAAQVVREYGKADLEEFFVALARSERGAPA